LLAHPDPIFRAGMRWYSNIGRRVWTFEVLQWLFADRRTDLGPTVEEFLNGGWKCQRKYSALG
jgi:anaerobic magnesium-protoporphyrin IX monomethyl ester cyclase